MLEAREGELLARLRGYRERVERDPDVAMQWRSYALKEMRELCEGLIGWTAPELHAPPPADVAERRRILADAVQSAPLFPPWGRQELAQALRALEDGQQDPLLTPAPTNRRATNPHDVIIAQLHLLVWIEWQVARGRAKADVEREAAAAIRKSAESFDQWRRVSLNDWLQRDDWESRMRAAHAAGEAEREGYPLRDSLWEMDRHLRDLKALAKNYKLAVNPGK
jgi:hypothetical protein